MSKFYAKIEMYKSEMKKLGFVDIDERLLHICTKSCGPSIYKEDASTVSGSDKAELERVKKNFLRGKLGMSHTDDLDGLVQHAIDTMGSGNKNKYRPIFYYILCQKSGKSPA